MMEVQVFDYVIYEGSLAGCLTAVEMSRKGYSVALVERRGFLGCDITATFRKYEEKRKYIEPDIVKEMEGLWKKENGCPEEIGEIKRKLLDWVEENKVAVFFYLDPCALLLQQSETEKEGEKGGEVRIGGILFCSKWGYFLMKGKCVIDAGQRAVLKGLAEGSVWKHGKLAVSILRYQGKSCQKMICQNGKLIELVESLKEYWPGLTKREKREAEGLFYKTFTNGQAFFLEVSFPVDEEETLGNMTLKGQKAILVADKLFRMVFAEMDVTAELLCYEPYVEEECRIEACGMINNLFYIHAGGKLLTGLEKIKGWISAGSLEKTLINEYTKCFFKNRDIILYFSDFQTVDWDACEVKLPFQRLMLKNKRKLPIETEVEVVIAGGGTAGVAAAIGAARSGVNTLVAEYYNGFGGTQTYGGITGYYFCHKDGFTNQFTKEMESFGLKNTVAGRMLWYTHAMKEEGIQLYNNTTVCDVIKEADQVLGIVTVCDGKWGIIRSEVTVDATGDGDLMEYAGVKCFLGAKDSGNVQDCGLMHYQGGGYNLDAVLQNKYEEVLRAVRMAHRFGGGIDFSPLLTPREGRLFEGEYIINLSDVVLQTRFSDTIAMAYSDNDPHGELSSRLSYMGMMPYHGDTYMVQIPYRACIPKEINGLLAASKSISGTQDAAGFLRMAGDLQNKGYAIGTAAAFTVIMHCNVRDIPMGTLHSILRHMHILDAEYFKKKRGKKEAEDLMEGLRAEKTDSLRRVLCMPSVEAVPVLKREFSQNQYSLSVGLALTWFHEKDALPMLKDTLHKLAETENIDDYDDKNRIKPGNNKGGIMGENCDYWRINQLLTVFAFMDEVNIEESVQTLIKKFTSGGSTIRSDTVYVSKRWDLHKIPHYDRLRTLLLYICRKPSKYYAEVLEQLAYREGLLGFLGGEEVYSSHNREKDDNCTGRQYQSAYMELSLGEALYKCGSQLGKEILERGLTDVHYILRRRAYQALLH